MAILRASWAALLLAVPGCCFTSHSEVIEETVVTESAPVVPPGYEVVSVCTRAELVRPETGSTYCATHTPSIATSEVFVEASFRTHDLARYAAGATLWVETGEGAARTEILRRALSGPVVPPGAPGTFTWTTRSLVDAPPAGWPPGAPVRFGLLDGTGAVASESVVVFTGPTVVPPPPRAIGEIQFCRPADLVGPEDDPYCPSTAVITAVAGGEGAVAMTYSLADRALLAQALTARIERRGRRDWDEVGRRDLPSVATTPGVVTFVLNLDLTTSAWRTPNTWRIRIVGDAEQELASGALEIQ